MITDAQVQTLYNAGYIEKYKGIYFYVTIKLPTLDEIITKNNIELPSTEWWDIYRKREQILKENINQENVIVLITAEELYLWDL